MRFELDEHHRNVTDEELLADLKRVASLLGSVSVTRAQQDDKGRFHSATYVRRFGGWFVATDRAGLQDSRTPPNIPETDLFRNIEGIWTKLGRQPRYDDLRGGASAYSNATYAKRFGSWRKALEAFVTYINLDETPQSEDSIRDWKIQPTTKHKTPRNINDRLRVRVFVRDNHTCQICGRVPGRDGVILHVDHVKAYEKGGETVMENLQTLCSKCNLGKGDFDLYVEKDGEATDVSI